MFLHKLQLLSQTSYGPKQLLRVTEAPVDLHLHQGNLDSELEHLSCNEIIQHDDYHDIVDDHTDPDSDESSWGTGRLAFALLKDFFENFRFKWCQLLFSFLS